MQLFFYKNQKKIFLFKYLVIEFKKPIKISFFDFYYHYKSNFSFHFIFHNCVKNRKNVLNPYTSFRIFNSSLKFGKFIIREILAIAAYVTDNIIYIEPN